MTTLPLRNSVNWLIPLTLALVCFALLPKAQAVGPDTDGSIPGSNDGEGVGVLVSRTTGIWNTGTGYQALNNLTAGNQNTATGVRALFSDTNGSYNTATGVYSLYSNTTGNSNTANGWVALANNTGEGNTALGAGAGYNLTTGNGNVCIGAGVGGVAGESNATRIRNIYPSLANARVVYVNSDDKIGTLASSRRFKEEIKPMEKASEVLFALKPVSFRYKKKVDPTRSLSFGLIAEEVAEVDPDLVTPDRDGKPETVRYEAVNAMLLNEFLKEHRKVEQQEATITQLKKDFQATVAELTARLNEQDSKIQKVSAQMEVSKFATGRIRGGGPAPQVVNN
jgi:hypothetical protein